MQLLRNVDLKTFHWFNDLSGHSATSDFIIVFFASYMAWLILIIFLVLIFWEMLSLEEKISDLFITIFSGFTSLGMVKVIQFFYHRPRPFLAIHTPKLFDVTTYSFPSAHSSFFFAFAFSIYFYNKKWGIYFLILTTIMTIGRVISSVHYPSDIFAGLILGFVVSCLIFKFIKKPIGKVFDKLFKKN